MNRADQREQTRERILDAAVEEFAAHGFEAAGTRAIAARAEVTQGLVTYHFSSKDELWRAAADRIFGRMNELVPPEEGRPGAAAIRDYVEFSARHPEVFHFMVDAGRRDDDRLRWLVDTHLETRFAALAGSGLGAAAAAHLYYAVVGAASLIFAVAPECRALTGRDPETAAEIRAHADLVVDLFVPPG
ncbi:MAG: helix-turn-helix domain-containing protein [Acidimicrobiales bacterium]|nr:helix-turn-helix domain-containing protein [Acidimicrobiales bacterium]